MPLLDAAGAPVPEPPKESTWYGMIEPHKGSPCFGYFDNQGDPVTLRVESIVALARDARTGRFVVVLSGAGFAPAMRDEDAHRLMRRLGWSTEK